MSEAVKSESWLPQAPQLIAIEARHTVDELFFGGARGGGKTDFLLGDFIARGSLDQGDVWQGILFRRTYPEMDEIIKRSLQLYPQTGAEWKAGAHEWRWHNGARLALRHLDIDADVVRYQGHSYSWIGWDEIGNWPTPFAYNAMKATLRGPAKGKRIRATGNPGGIGHQWVRAYFVDATRRGTWVHRDDATGMLRVFIPSRVQDNQVLLERDPGYVDRLRGVGDPELVQAWLEGDWDAVVGSYFAMWRLADVLVEPFEVPAAWPLIGCLDYGESNPSWFGLLTVDYDDRVYCISEYYAADRGASEHARAIRQCIDGCPWTDRRRPALILADPSMFTKRRTSEPHLDRSPADTFREHGLHLKPANNDRVNGWRVCKDALYRGQFKAFKGWTEQLCRSIPTLQRDPNNPEDVLKAGDDHPADGWRYGLVHCYRPGKPSPLRVAAPNSGDALLDLLNKMDQGNRRYG